jgi:hypothetical protein
MRKLILAGLTAALLAGASGAAAIAQPVERWGHWDPAWGAAPPPPSRALMRRWRGRETGWYDHVHGCMARYHAYDPRRDMYREGRRWVACRD